LIIQDADGCGENNRPDYSFLPFPFATSNPGAQGAASALRLIEERRGSERRLALVERAAKRAFVGDP